MALWTPAEITTAVWWDPSDSSNYTLVSSAYSEILDKSGNSRTASQDTAIRRPSHIAAGQNGLDFARFDGSNDQLNLVSFEQTSGQTVILACDTTSIGTSFRGFMERTSPVVGNLALLFGGNSALSLSLRPNVYWNNAANATAQPSAVQKKCLLQWGFESGSPASAFTKLDAGTPVSATFTASALTNWLLIGGADTQNSAFDFYEAVILPPGYTSGEVELVEGYLAWKWGLQANLPSGHPYEDAAPEIAGGPATNTVSGTVAVASVAAPRTVLALNSVTPFEVLASSPAAGGNFTFDFGESSATVLLAALDSYGLLFQPEHAYLAGDLILPIPYTGYVYEITTPGTSNVAAPNWSTVVGGTTAVGTAVATTRVSYKSLAHGPVTPISTGVVEELWTPAEITTALWLDYSDATKYTLVSSAYSEVLDKSGNNRHATQATPESRPSYQAAGQNGLDFARFDGTDDFMSLVQFAQVSGQTLFFFGDTTNLQTGDRGFFERSSPSAANLAFLFARTATARRPSVFWNPSTGSSRAIQPSAVQTKAGIRWGFASGSPASALTQLNAGTPVTDTFTASALSNWLQFPGAATQYSAVDVYEIIMLPPGATQAELDFVWGYGMWKWGLEANLPSGHPYELAAPTIAGEEDVKQTIETITLGSAGEFDFDSIPGGYKRLIIEGHIRGSVAAVFDSCVVVFNEDTTTANYRRQDGNFVNGGSGFGQASDNGIFYVPAGTSPAGATGKVRCVVEDYTGSASKDALGVSTSVDNTSALRVANRYTYNNSLTAAITRIRIRADGHATDGLIGTLTLYGEL